MVIYAKASLLSMCDTLYKHMNIARLVFVKAAALGKDNAAFLLRRASAKIRPRCSEGMELQKLSLSLISTVLSSDVHFSAFWEATKAFQSTGQAL